MALSQTRARAAQGPVSGSGYKQMPREVRIGQANGDTSSTTARMIFLSYFLFGDFTSQTPPLYIVTQFSFPLWTYPLNPVNALTCTHLPSKDRLNPWLFHSAMQTFLLFPQAQKVPLDQNVQSLDIWGTSSQSFPKLSLFSWPLLRGCSKASLL